MLEGSEKKLLGSVLSLARKVCDRIGRKVKLMEVCGTHTMVIAKSGLKTVFADSLELISGPGCPVCVTDQKDIDKMILYSRLQNITICTFGDMIKVPGSFSSLEIERAYGAKVEIFYSPNEALMYAMAYPQREAVFVGIGFETTIPLVAYCILEAKKRGVKNFSVLSLHKILPPALRVLLDDPDLSIDGLILPGHVSTITGRKAFDFIGRDYGIPSCISGFEPQDIIEAIGIILLQILKNRPEVEIGYRRVVKENGNLTAQEIIRQVFEPCDAKWRGFGEIPGSGLLIKKEFSGFDALKKFSLPEVNSESQKSEKSGCICGDIIKGKKTPLDCQLFSSVCNPSRPFGPCMVSQEGACAAYYHYGV
ncbi:MAG: hydrogenase formation protein HypD [Deltaproteobacteria bacterium]|nr:hydrogenase formation protein HypD [Deltaproteobacteria bacterium]